jgi:TolB-like protein/Tfp pilus assembly protein PilF
MTPAQLQTIEEIYREALDQKPDQLSAFLDTACEGDELLRRKVEALLSSRERAASFIETSAVGLATRIIQNGQADLLVGQTIGHYKISESIGIGGMGEVYLATDITAGRKAALKLLPMRFTGDAERLKRFQQEAHAVVGLNHPNILTVYEVGEDHSIHYIASELIEGETLRERLEHGRMQLSEAIDIAIQVASALAAAHQAGIVHRDIKPENIMLRPDGYVKVLDFGIAKLAEQEVPVTIPRDEALLLVETNLGSILGTVRYMSPEQACGAHVDKRTDIWSLGVVLYEMVTGHAPFTGDTPKEVMSAILEKEPPPLGRYLTHAPVELQQIIAKALRKDRGQRYHSARDLLEALKDLRRKLEVESFFASGFFEEVKRRKVYRVAAAYIIAAAGIIQLASVAFPAWDLPNWALRLVIVLLLIGFPIALVLGWAFDLTSQGIRATSSAVAGTHRRRSVIMLVATGAIISAAAGFFLLPRVSAYKVDKSIAVLPFENLSRDPDNAYFADGIEEEILTRLAQIADVKVISRSSTQRYQSKPRNLAQIAKQLGVANILEGSVQKAADQVRVSVQLINAQTDSHLWAESYDRKLTDIFGVESEIAKGIAESLQAKLTGQEEQTLALKPTNNLEAYDAYLRGLAFETGVGYSFDSLPKIIDFYERAVQLDPSFALAWGRLSCANAYCYFIGEYRPIRATSPAGGPADAYRDAARKALENAQKLQPNSPETLLALGYYQFWVLRDFELAKSTFRLVHKKLRGSSAVPRALGSVSQVEGHWDESIAYMEQALVLDPLNPDILSDTAKAYAMLRQFPTALKLIDRALDILPNNVELVSVKAIIYQAQGNLQEAAKLLPDVNAGTASNAVFVVKLKQLTFERNFGEAVRLLQARLAQFQHGPLKGGYQVWLAVLQRLAGDTAGAKATAEEALKTLESLDERLQGNPNVVHALSLAKAELGEKDSALKDAERAIMLAPSDKNPVDGPALEESLAQIYTLFGENGRAISILTRLLQTPYSSLTYHPLPITPAHLRLDPRWDPLRGDPAFQKLCQEKQP